MCYSCCFCHHHHLLLLPSTVFLQLLMEFPSLPSGYFCS